MDYLQWDLSSQWSGSNGSNSKKTRFDKTRCPPTGASTLPRCRRYQSMQLVVGPLHFPVHDSQVDPCYVLAAAIGNPPKCEFAWRKVGLCSSSDPGNVRNALCVTHMEE